jgi:hypothetical protein
MKLIVNIDRGYTPSPGNTVNKEKTEDNRLQRAESDYRRGEK